MRYKAIVMYDGTMFHGFQIQEELRTVQLEIEKVLKIITKKETKIYPAGRTDTGVHAIGQVFHFDYEVEMKEWQIKNAINSRLPKDIYVKNINIVNDDFHADDHPVGEQGMWPPRLLFGNRDGRAGVQSPAFFKRLACWRYRVTGSVSRMLVRPRNWLTSSRWFIR